MGHFARENRMKFNISQQQQPPYFPQGSLFVDNLYIVLITSVLLQETLSKIRSGNC